jgi:hypothetical protein
MINDKFSKRKVYFVSSLAAKSKYADVFKEIANIFRELDFVVWDDVNKVNHEEAKNFDSKQIKDYYLSVQKRIKEADIFVAELSQPSSAVGYEIGYAVANDKPVLILRSDKLKTTPGAPLRGNPSRLLTIFKYNKYNLRERIESFLKKAERGIFVKRLPIEFTQDQVDHIQMRQKKDKKTSFNATVRSIIEEDITRKS